MKRDNIQTPVAEPHPLDDLPDLLSPKLRQGRRIAVRQNRIKGVLFKFTEDEYATVRRVAHHLGYSLAQTMRLVMKEKELSIWPDGKFPPVYEIDADKRKAKIAAERRTKSWSQKRANALQAKEARIRKEIQRVNESALKKEVQRAALVQELTSIEDVRAKRRGLSKKMYREIGEVQLNAREMLNESVADVEIELLREAEQLGRKLTENEKSFIGSAVRAAKGSAADLELEAIIERAILDAERKTMPRRKLSVKEKWEVRRSVRLKHQRTLLHK